LIAFTVDRGGIVGVGDRRDEEVDDATTLDILALIICIYGWLTEVGARIIGDRASVYKREIEGLN
jgi:hypothetical protein